MHSNNKIVYKSFVVIAKITNLFSWKCNFSWQTLTLRLQLLALPTWRLTEQQAEEYETAWNWKKSFRLHWVIARTHIHQKNRNSEYYCLSNRWVGLMLWDTTLKQCTKTCWEKKKEQIARTYFETTKHVESKMRIAKM